MQESYFKSSAICLSATVDLMSRTNHCVQAEANKKLVTVRYNDGAVEVLVYTYSWREVHIEPMLAL